MHISSMKLLNWIAITLLTSTIFFSLRTLAQEVPPPWKSNVQLIIALDGVNEVKVSCWAALGAIDFLPERQSDYLGPTLADQWGLDGTAIQSVSWNGLPDTGDTYTSFIERTRKAILFAYETGRPVVIVAHSWGT